MAAAGGLLAATLAAVPAVRAEISSPLIAGLPWRSGATVGGFPCLADLRHRALDAVNVYLAPQSFTDMVTNSGSSIPQYGTGGFTGEAQRVKRSGFGRPCQAP